MLVPYLENAVLLDLHQLSKRVPYQFPSNYSTMGCQYLFIAVCTRTAQHVW